MRHSPHAGHASAHHSGAREGSFERHERYVDARARRGGHRDERGRDRASRPRHREAGDDARVGAVEPDRAPRGASPSRGALPAIDARVRRARAHAARRDRRAGRARRRAARRRARRGGPGGAAREAGQGRSGDAVDAERRRRRAGRRGRLQRGEKRGRLGNPSRRSFEGHSKKRLRLAREPRTARPRPTVPAQGATHLPALRGVDGEVFPVALRVARLCVFLRRLRRGVRRAGRARSRRAAPRFARARRASCCTAPSSRTSRRRR